MRRLAALFLGVAVLLPPVALAQDSTTRLTIIHLNDLPQAYESQGRGGLSRVASIISDQRAGGRNVVVTHAGGALSPSPLSAIDRGSHMIKLLNVLPVGVFGAGGHDFDFGPAVFLARAREAAFPVLAGNIATQAGAALDGVAATAIREVDGFNLGFLALLSPTAEQRFRTSGLRIAPVEESARRLAADLRARGADIVLALAHVDDDEAGRLLRLGVLDIVLRGDSRELQILQTGRALMAASMPGGARLVAIDLRLERLTVEIAPSFDGDDKDGDAAIDLSGATRQEVRWNAEARVIDTVDAPTDYLMLGHIQQTLFLHATATEEVLLRLPTELDNRKAVVRTRGALLPEYAADAVRAAFDADVALLNAGNFRGDRVYAAGAEFRRGDLLRELPFGNRAVVLDVTGADIIAALENGFSQIAGLEGRFPQVSGMVVDFDAKARPGRRVLAVRDAGGKALVRGRHYRLATSDFVADGRDGYTVFARRPRLGDVANSPTLADLVAERMRRIGPPQPGAPRLRQR